MAQYQVLQRGKRPENIVIHSGTLGVSPCDQTSLVFSRVAICIAFDLLDPLNTLWSILQWEGYRVPTFPFRLLNWQSTLTTRRLINLPLAGHPPRTKIEQRFPIVSNLLRVCPFFPPEWLQVTSSRETEWWSKLDVGLGIAISVQLKRIINRLSEYLHTVKNVNPFLGLNDPWFRFH